MVANGVAVVFLAGMTLATWRGDVAVVDEPVAAAEPVGGESLFRSKGCAGCHTRGASVVGGSVAPDLGGLPDRAASRVEGMSATEYVRQSIREPGAFAVPGFGEVVDMPALPLTDDEVEAMVDYLLGT